MTAYAYTSPRAALTHLLSDLKKSLEATNSSIGYHEDGIMSARTTAAHLEGQIESVENVIAHLSGLEQAGIEIKRKPDADPTDRQQASQGNSDFLRRA